MIKIAKDGHTILCTNNTFETMYKRLGYKIVNEPKKEIAKVNKVEKQEEEKDIPVIEVKNEKNTKGKNIKTKK